MALLPNRFTAIACSVIVLIAQLACVCRSASAATHPAEAKPAGHACCKHDKHDAPSGDSKSTPDNKSGDNQDNCPHCAGFTAPLQKSASHAVAAVVVLPLDLYASSVHPLIARHEVSSIPPNQSCPSLISSTLLRLSCALNL
jgi:hypothetical protein